MKTAITISFEWLILVFSLFSLLLLILNSYLITGNLSDLTLTFGEKTWHIHKALACCHSKWFQKAVTSGFEETNSGAIILNDDPEFADAIDCMVSYFYKAGYTTSEYDTSASLLHAQVATIADKYDCPSLYELARASFEKTVMTVESDEWIAIAAFIYEHMTTELSAHKELRNLVITAAVNRPAVLLMTLGKDSMVELLRSDADLATDLLLPVARLHTNKAKDVSKCIFRCSDCQYVHAGSRNCSYVESGNSLIEMSCPRCGNQSGLGYRPYAHTSDQFQAFSCPSCDGIQTE